MKKVLILVNGLYIGGFSKSLINLLYCIERNPSVSIDLCSFDKSRMELSAEIPKSVNILTIDLEFDRSILSKLPNLQNRILFGFQEKISRFFLRKSTSHRNLMRFIQKQQIIKAKRVTNDLLFMSNYDCVISWEEGLCNYILTYRVHSPKRIGYIHPNYREVELNEHMDKYMMKSLDSIVTISQSCYDTLCSVFPKERKRIKYVPNRMNYSYLVRKSNEFIVPKPNKYTLCTVARVVDNDKAVFRIVELAYKLKKDGLDFEWWVIGKGSDYQEFCNRVINAQLEDAIIPLGAMENPYPYIVSADLFVLQSHREGRPVAVDEAILLKKPVLVTDYSSAYEQVDSSCYGFIVKDDFNSIYNKLNELIRNKYTASKSNIDERIASLENCNQFIDMVCK